MVYFQVTARDAVLVATAQPITKDLADSVAHTAAIHSKSFAKRRLALLDPRTELDKKQICYRYHDRSLIARLRTTRIALQQQYFKLLWVCKATFTTLNAVNCFSHTNTAGHAQTPQSRLNFNDMSPCRHQHAPQVVEPESLS